MPDDKQIIATDLNRNKENGTLLDPYMDWAEAQGIPLHLDFGHDLLALETKPWGYYEARGCFAHTHGNGDFMACYVLEVPAGGKTKPIHHVYEAVFYGLKGHGSAVVWTPTGEKKTFEFGPMSAFAIPLNHKYQFFNGSGTEPLRVSCTNDLPMTLNLFHNHEFIFENPFAFPERMGDKGHFDGEGNYVGVGKGTHIWETNYVPDLTNFELKELEDRGKGSTNMTFVFADGTVHAHTSEIPKGRYKKAHRHAAGTHVHAVTGEGYSLLWYVGDEKFVEIPWRHGIMYTPPFWMFHQHFNTSPSPARYFACSLGSRRYPILGLRRRGAEGLAKLSVTKGGRQIEYEDQDYRIHRKWLEAIAKNGVTSEMGDIFDEKAIMALPPEKLTGKIYIPHIKDNIS